MTCSIKAAQFVYGSLYKTPNSFCKYFCKTNDRSSRATRQSIDCNNFCIPVPRYRNRTNKLQRCITYQESRLATAFPQILRHSRKKIQILLQKLSIIFVQLLASKICLRSLHIPFMIH